MNKIFCIGLSRTATTSLHLAFVAAGIPACHYPADEGVRWLSGDFSPATVERHRAFSDIPVAACFRRLHAANPDAKFILTRRREDAWLESCARFFASTPPPSQYTVARDYFRLAVYGSLLFERDTFLERYRAHNRAVTDHFGNAANFRAIDIDGGLSWQDFADFIGIEPPDLPFPNIATPEIGGLSRVGPDAIEQASAQVRRLLGG
ncbi:MAG: sulfotransferase [Alphaproteobacteria bacterium]